MKTKLTILLAAVLLGATGYSQILDTNTNPPSLGGALGKATSFLSTGTNWSVYAGGLWNATTRQAGGRIAAVCKINDYAGTGLGLDVIDRDITMPTATLQLQAPIRLSSTVTLVTYGYTGMSMGISGMREGNGTVGGLLGAGEALCIKEHFRLSVGAEVRTGFKGEFLTGMLGWHF